jgi:hypothetical protein
MFINIINITENAIILKILSKMGHLFCYVCRKFKNVIPKANSA